MTIETKVAPARPIIPFEHLQARFDAIGVQSDEHGSWRMVAVECGRCGARIVAAVREGNMPSCRCGGPGA